MELGRPSQFWMYLGISRKWVYGTQGDTQRRGDSLRVWGGGAAFEPGKALGRTVSSPGVGLQALQTELPVSVDVQSQFLGISRLALTGTTTAAIQVIPMTWPYSCTNALGPSAPGTSGYCNASCSH